MLLFYVIDFGDDMMFAKSSSETKDMLICNDFMILMDLLNLVIKVLDLFCVKMGV